MKQVTNYADLQINKVYIIHNKYSNIKTEATLKAIRPLENSVYVNDVYSHTEQYNQYIFLSKFEENKKRRKKYEDGLVANIGDMLVYSNHVCEKIYEI